MWNLDFHTLIERYTFGQLQVLALGGELLHQRKDSKTRLKEEAHKVITKTPPKSFKKMTGEEYMKYLEGGSADWQGVTKEEDLLP